MHGSNTGFLVLRAGDLLTLYREARVSMQDIPVKERETDGLSPSGARGIRRPFGAFADERIEKANMTDIQYTEFARAVS
jgi:hypothetical protein